MPIKPPRLDDRTFQELVDEAKRRINELCPKWTDHNVSDPGITLIELFAHMTEQILYRLNRTPEKNYLAFLKLVGLRLNPAVPATGDVLFSLTNPLIKGDRPVEIPARTEAATKEYDNEGSVVFTTDRKVTVNPPSLVVALSAPDLNVVDESTWVDLSAAATAGQSLDALPLAPAVGTRPALLLGFDADLGAHQLALTLDWVDPSTQPPSNWKVRLQWEVMLGPPQQLRWEEPQAEPPLPPNAPPPPPDAKRITASLLLPRKCAAGTYKGLAATTWLRLVAWSPDGKSVAGAPEPRATMWRVRVSAEVPGVSVRVTQGHDVPGEEVGVSDGRPGQSFSLKQRPALPPAVEDHLAPTAAEPGPWNPWEVMPNFVEVVDEKGVPFRDAAGNPLAWSLVPDFGVSRPDDRHVVFDPAAGTIEFGPSVQGRQFGAIPPENARVRVKGYRVGGGTRGNVPAEQVNTLRNSFPAVRRVINRRPMLGGRDVETVEQAMVRAPSHLRMGFRAITAEDYEYWASMVPGVSRAFCVRPPPAITVDGLDPNTAAAPSPDLGEFRPGVVRLRILPNMPRPEGDYYETRILAPRRAKSRDVPTFAAELVVPAGLMERVRRSLQPRSVLAAALEVAEPKIVWVWADVSVKTRRGFDPHVVERNLEHALYFWLHPVHGGDDHKGWPLGRAVTIDRVYALALGVEGVEEAVAILNVLRESVPGNKDWQSQAPYTDANGLKRYDRVPVPPDAVVHSGWHQIKSASAGQNAGASAKPGGTTT